MTGSFAHNLRLDRIADGERIDLVADDSERNAVAERLGLETLGRLDAHATFYRTKDVIRAEGRLAASLDQRCVVTGEPVAAHIDESFALLFMPEPQSGRSNEEIELAAQDCDVVFHDGSTIDLGGAIADTLALSLDLYPRCAEADAALKEAGVLSEADASPFAMLAKLKLEKE